MRRGYILTSQGVHVGLSRETTEGAFSFVKLDRQPGEPDWSPVPACITLDDKLPAACGTMLVDTGVSAMFMTLPPQQVGDGAAGLAPGTQVSISVGTQDKHKELYSFEAGIGSAMAPEGVHLDVSDKRVFVNTSYHFLNGYDVLYDADGGYVGFRRR
jgi:hypothetical protein